MSDDWDEHKTQKIPEIRDAPFDRDDMSEMGWWSFFLGLMSGAAIAVIVMECINAIPL